MGLITASQVSEAEIAAFSRVRVASHVSICVVFQPRACSDHLDGAGAATGSALYCPIKAASRLHAEARRARARLLITRTGVPLSAAHTPPAAHARRSGQIASQSFPCNF